MKEFLKEWWPFFGLLFFWFKFLRKEQNEQNSNSKSGRNAGTD